jgi:hypothetical protein
MLLANGKDPKPEFALLWIDSRDHSGNWVVYSKFVNCETHEILGDVVFMTTRQQWVATTFKGETRNKSTMLAAQRWVEKMVINQQDLQLKGV